LVRDGKKVTKTFDGTPGFLMGKMEASERVWNR
jgi:hypothetical protein